MGVKIRICSKCGFEDYDFLSSLGHSYKNIVVSATCTEKGYTLHECIKCDYEYRDTYTTTAAHSYGSWTEMLSTCTTKVLCRFCAVCGSSSMKSESGSWHNYTTSVVVPTCSEQGYTLHSCLNCGNSCKDTFVDSTGEHNLVDFYVIISTCAERRVLKTCTTCHINVEVDEKAIEEHKYVDFVCSVCGMIEASKGLTFALDEDGEGYSVTGIGTCKDAVLVIPNTYMNKPVTKIASTAFSSGTFTRVIIPDSVMTIDKSAFVNCKKMTSVTIGKSVTDIGSDAFSSCISLESVIIPDNVISIGSSAFSGCKSLTSVIIGKGLTYIDSSLFSLCTNLEIVTIPDNVKSIGAMAFMDCISLTSVFISAGVTRIETAAFSGCIALTDLTFAENSQLTSIAGFSDCTSLESITIPNSVTKIGANAFSGCISLKSITIPDFVTDIDGYAFSDCTSLVNVTMGKSVANVVNTAFSHSSAIKTLTIRGDIPSGGYDIYSIETVVVEDGVTIIGNSAFISCKSLINVIISNTVTSIAPSAFSHCTSLVSITIPNSVTSIGKNAFNYCPLLTTVLFEENSKLTSIEEGAFKFCGFANIVVPNSVTSIGDYAFGDCRSLIDITIPNTIRDIGYRAFFYCTSLESINYQGSIEQWNTINIVSGWDDYALSTYKVYCTDKTITKWEVITTERN